MGLWGRDSKPFSTGIDYKSASLLRLPACCAPSPPATAWTTANANCACTGANTGFPLNQIFPFNNVTMFPANYGKTCAAWDQVDCPAQWWGTNLGSS